MSESLIIEGKQYISSRRAAEMAGYSNDYVGQLCRSGKLVCRMVGRFWYVDQNSILKHQKESLRPNQTVFKKTDFLAQTSGLKSAFISNKKAIPADVIPQAVVAKQCAPQVGAPQVGAPQVGAPQVGTPQAVASQIIIPRVATAEVAGIKPPPEWKWTFIKGSEDKIVSSSDFADDTDDIRFGLPISIGVGLSALLIVVMAGNIRFHLPTQIPFQLQSAETSVANVLTAAQSLEQSAQKEIVSIWNSLSSGVVSLASRFHSGAKSSSQAHLADQYQEPLASSVIPPGEVGKVTAEHGGIVVIPTAGMSADETKLEKSIQNSFSDNVVVKPNADGTSGVITPVFRTVAGHDFMYVLVPVKATSTAPAIN